MRGSKTGVYIGCSGSEAHDIWGLCPEKIVGYEVTGCTRSMFANRISYCFDFKGEWLTILVFVFVCILQLIFILSAISPCTTGLKALYDPSYCTSTNQLSDY